jgi:serine protease Do
MRIAAAQYAVVAPTPDERAQQYRALGAEVAHLEKQGMVLRKVVSFVKPTVVHIDAEKTDSINTRSRNRFVEEAGSGTIIKMGNRYYVLTNRHVIRSAPTKSIKIKLSDGRVIYPTSVWSDAETDIAVMAVDAEGLVPAEVGNSDQVDIGDFVLAVGSPFGLSHSVTFGIVSAKGRRDLELGEDVKFQDFLQTDAAINPGNSGGPLISLRGEVIGMNTAIASNSGGSEGIGFTIPINMVMVIAKQLVERGSVARAYLGVTLDRNFNQSVASRLGLPRAVGARVVAITQNSPAEAAKIQVDDVILEINGTAVDDDNHLVSMVSVTEIGRELPVLIYRDGKAMKVTVKVANRSQFPKPVLTGARSGE